jgi:hypothetical protein
MAGSGLGVAGLGSAGANMGTSGSGLTSGIGDEVRMLSQTSVHPVRKLGDVLHRATKG